MLDARQREAIEKKAASDGQFAIAAALLALAEAVHDAGPPASVQAIDLSFVKLAEATTAAGSVQRVRHRAHVRMTARKPLGGKRDPPRHARPPPRCGCLRPASPSTASRTARDPAGSRERYRFEFNGDCSVCRVEVWPVGSATGCGARRCKGFVGFVGFSRAYT